MGPRASTAKTGTAAFPGATSPCYQAVATAIAMAATVLE